MKQELYNGNISHKRSKFRLSDVIWTVVACAIAIGMIYWRLNG